MNKEAQKIRDWIDFRFGSHNTFNEQLLSEFLLFVTEELGYHKLPEEKPRLLSIVEMQEISANMDDQGDGWYAHKEVRAILKVQRDIDVSHYGGKK